MKNEHEFKITFAGGAGSVTGANFLIEFGEEKILVDCGLLQKTKLADELNWEPFPYDVSSVGHLIITHAHIDHIGRIPKLVKDGFRGKIVSTPPTMELAHPMLEDTVAILGRNKEEDLAKIYNAEVLAEVFPLWEAHEYKKPWKIGPATVRFLDAGHILGSTMIEISYGGKVFVFTGDLGNSPSPILPDTDKLENVDYLIMESVYGDRNHESRDQRKKLLEEVIEDNYKSGGALVIPTFSLERTQELLFEINDLVENQRIPAMPIFLDSPLAIKLTHVYKNFTNYLNDGAKKLISDGDDIYNFPGLTVTKETEESKAILKAPNPKIIIAGSGMSNGGRIIHHEINYLPDSKNTLLLTGYQSMGTLGRTIEEGAKVVRISGEDVAVQARIRKISGYSGHKDADHLLEFVEDVSDKVKKVFVVLGEPKSSMFLAQRIRDYLGIDAVVPKAEEVVSLKW
jgi:metallo-beta-lactamase family protein